jgi:hypothetical protein
MLEAASTQAVLLLCLQALLLLRVEASRPVVLAPMVLGLAAGLALAENPGQMETRPVWCRGASAGFWD